MKTCTKCSQSKPLSEYYKRKDTADGLAYQCKSCANAYAKANVNPERNREACRQWRRRNKDKSKAAVASWNKRNPEKRQAYCAERRARLAAVPLSEDERFMVEETYALCRLRSEVTGVPHEVDHIVPLQGNDVCGLHVPWNLQVLTQHDNRVKSNR